jgi:hypothetical protein
MAFKLPEDITALSTAELEALVTEVRAYARGVAENDDSPAADIETAATAFSAVLAEKNSRAAVATSRAALASSLDETEEEVDEDEEADVEEEAEEAAAEVVAATQAPTVVAARGGKKRSTIDVPPVTTEDAAVIMVSAPDVPGFAGGVELKSFAQAGQIIEARLSRYPAPTAAQRMAAQNAPSGRQLSIQPGGTTVRHGGVMFRRQFPEALRLNAGDNAYGKVLAATKESRLPGGSLLKSAELLVKGGRAITAAVGWCAPSEVIYSLCDLTSLDGMLDIPELQASRGGFQLPLNGGPDFSVVWDGIGNVGDVILTEYDIENGALKECFEIPCPDFTEVRLDAAYLCLTGSLLQRRGYPEVIELFSQQAMKALAHKVNASVIDRIATASGPAIVIPADASGDDAASAVLSGIDLAIQDMKYRWRMEQGTTIEAVFPYWMLVQVRAALARRYGVAMLDVTDAMILAWFAIRKALPRFVYDWQDAYTGLVTGPGGATPLTALPLTVDFLLYPAGTWTKIVQDVVNLDTIYDNALLTTNQYTAVFAEDGFNVIQTCPESRLYTVSVDPSGVVGCCA